MGKPVRPTPQPVRPTPPGRIPVNIRAKRCGKCGQSYNQFNHRVCPNCKKLKPSNGGGGGGYSAPQPMSDRQRAGLVAADVAAVNSHNGSNNTRNYMTIRERGRRFAMATTAFSTPRSTNIA